MRSPLFALDKAPDEARGLLTRAHGVSDTRALQQPLLLETGPPVTRACKALIEKPPRVVERKRARIGHAKALKRGRLFVADCLGALPSALLPALDAEDVEWVYGYCRIFRLCRVL